LKIPINRDPTFLNLTRYFDSTKQQTSEDRLITNAESK